MRRIRRTIKIAGMPIGSQLCRVVVAHWHGVTLSLSLEDELEVPGLILWMLLAVHFTGIMAIARLTHKPVWLVLPALLLLQPLIVSLKTRKIRLLSASFAPFFVAHALLLIRLILALLSRGPSSTFGPLIVPEPWGNLLSLNWAVSLSTLWTLLAQARITALTIARQDVHRLSLLGYSMLGLTMLWSAVTYFSLRTAGVTGSDPYAYVQMAVDLARDGTFLHTFGLATQVNQWEMPLWPTVPVGYLSPDPRTGAAATVWPPGYSAILALAYLVLGETGLYISTPFLGIFAILALWYLCVESLRTLPRPERIAAAGFATFILATSYQQIEHVLVPFADIPSQLFTVLAVLLAIRSRNRARKLLAYLGGVSLGLAFSIRYTQVLLAPSLLVLLVMRTRTQNGLQSTGSARYRLLSQLLWFATGAWSSVLPVLWYHQTAFGSPFSVGSQELRLFAWEHIPASFANISTDLFRTNEFFYVIPFVVLGFLRLRRDSPMLAITLLLWLVGIILIHLPYQALRIRDLLSIFPIFALLGGVGIATVLGQLQHRRHPMPFSTMDRRFLLVGFVIVSLWLRARVTWELPFVTSFNTFGYLTAEQRLSFDRLGRITPSSGIMAASLNSGPILLYSDRQIIRPAYMSEDEWLDFVARAMNAGRRVFLLMDGEEMKKPLQVVRLRYRTVLVSVFPMPYFYPGGRSANSFVELYEVAP